MALRKLRSRERKQVVTLIGFGVGDERAEGAGEL